MTTQAPTTFAEAEARLAESLPHYESRPQQQALARAIEVALDRREHFFGEAGCGTGKSLGYLVPAIQQAKKTGRRVVVTTATKALQDQLAEKDLPFLQEHLGIDFTFAVLKGRSNYLCMERFNEPETITEVASYRKIEQELSAIPFEDFSGERDAFRFEIHDAEWRKLSVSADECLRNECPFKTECFANKAKDRALNADVVVVNHALFCQDLAFGHALLGPYDLVIADEVHELADYAANVFGSRITEASFGSLTSEIHGFAQRHDHDRVDDYSEAIGNVTLAATDVFLSLPDLSDDDRKRGRDKLRVTDGDILAIEEQWVRLASALDALKTILGGFRTSDRDVSAKRSRLVKRCTNAKARLNGCFDPLFCRWIEIEPVKSRGRFIGERKVLATAPVRVGTILNELLFDRPEREREDGSLVDDSIQFIGVSATVITNGSFDFITRELGCEHYRSIDVGTPFDFDKQALLYVPNYLPEPAGASRRQWTEQAKDEILRLVQVSEGRALLLFTSVADMNDAYRYIAPQVPWTCLKQGERANRALAAEFKTDTHSVLFATKSFFTGVDVQGESCSLVVISKLPFPVPGEPLTEAREALIVSEGGNAFRDLAIPTMELPLKQAFGRLIRHRGDRGVVAILDKRLTTKGYGQSIVKRLPDARLVGQYEAVRDFFAEEDALAV